MNIRTVWFSILLVFIADRDIHPQTALKKVRMGIQSTNIGFLPFHVAYHKGFYREQGIELETIFMSTQAVNAAFVRGDIDYSAAVNGIVQTIVRGAPAKILACAVDRPLQSFVSRKEIRSARELKGKKIGGSTPGGTASLMADLALKHFGLEPGRDVAVVPLRGNRVAALESGAVDAAVRIWDPESGQCLATLSGHGISVSAESVTSRQAPVRTSAAPEISSAANAHPAPT